MAEIKYKVADNFDHTFDEKGNTFLALRKISWGDSDNVKLDIRKWYVNSAGEETIGKGVSFLTDEGPHELTKVLLENDFGDTFQVIEAIKNRENFMTSLVRSLNKEYLEENGIEVNDEDIDEEYYDPKEMLI